MLDFRYDTFLELCRTKSYTKAAKNLHVSQPTVSQMCIRDSGAPVHL